MKEQDIHCAKGVHSLMEEMDMYINTLAHCSNYNKQFAYSF